MSQKLVDFQESNFEQKLLSLKDTQESIQALSAWCLKYQQQHKKVVGCWLHVLKKVRVEQRVSLFYLANDIIQYSKRKNYPFVDSFAPALQKATPLVRDDHIKEKIKRLFKIWSQRSVYEEAFLSDLSELLTVQTNKNKANTADLVQNYQPHLLYEKIRRCSKLEKDTDIKFKDYRECKLPPHEDVKNTIENALRDRNTGTSMLSNLNNDIDKIKTYLEALESEIKSRNETIGSLEIAEQFYETQRGDAKVVCNAYRNFAIRVKNLKKKLEATIPLLKNPSPIPSPDIDAPSPSSESDLDMPDHRLQTSSYNVNQSSFFGSTLDTSMDISNVASSVNETSSYDPNLSFNNNYSNLLNDTHNLQFNSFMYDNSFTSTAGNDSNILLPSSDEGGNPIEVIGNSNANNVYEFNSSISDTPVDNSVQQQPASSQPPLTETDLSSSPNKLPGFAATGSLIDSSNELSWMSKQFSTSFENWSLPSNQSSSMNSSNNFLNSIPIPPASTTSPLTNPNPPQQLESISSIPLPTHVNNNMSVGQNLIPLTNAPLKSDSDYRTALSLQMSIPPPMPQSVPLVPVKPDNVESVDMDLSDDEESRNRKKNMNEGAMRPPPTNQTLMPPPMSVWNFSKESPAAPFHNVNHSTPMNGGGGSNVGAINTMNLPPPPPAMPMSVNAQTVGGPPNMYHPHGDYQHLSQLQNFGVNPPPPMSFPGGGDSSTMMPYANSSNNGGEHFNNLNQPRYQPAMATAGNAPTPMMPYQGDSNISVYQNITTTSSGERPTTPQTYNMNERSPSMMKMMQKQSPVRSNLKEISLSNSSQEDNENNTVSSSSPSSSFDNRKHSESDDMLNNASVSNAADELFNVFMNAGGQDYNIYAGGVNAEGDETDDLYNNIEENVMSAAAMMNDNAEHAINDALVDNCTANQPQQQPNEPRIPFQAKMPKAQLRQLAPPQMYDDDLNNPCPVVSYIDLSENDQDGDQASTSNDYGDNTRNEQHSIPYHQTDYYNQNELPPPTFGNQPSPHFRPRGPAPPSNQNTIPQIRWNNNRFQSPRHDFRPRHSQPREFHHPYHNNNNNTKITNRFQRPPYIRPQFSNDFNSPRGRGNYQNNSPRMMRPFRRAGSGW